MLSTARPRDVLDRHERNCLTMTEAPTGVPTESSVAVPMPRIGDQAPAFEATTTQGAITFGPTSPAGG